MKRAWIATVACIVLTGCQWPESREVVVPEVRHAVDIGKPRDEKFLGEGLHNEQRPRMTFPPGRRPRWLTCPAS